MMRFFDKTSRVQFLLKKGDIAVSLLREDELHPLISGNKFRKLKYNLQEFWEGAYSALLTFGGAYSNHIAAVAAAAKEFGIPVIAIIRGEELKDRVEENPTLSFARECGVQLEFVSREIYRQRQNEKFIQELISNFGNVYVLPEGGTNSWAVKACEEILNENTCSFDFICTAVGTGGTISGLANSAEEHQKVLGFPALKNAHFLYEEINKFSHRSNFELNFDYHFGGYAKVTDELIDFINEFKQQYNVSLEPIYTGKMLFGILDLIQKKHFPSGSNILAIHTGGLQGIQGMNQKLKKENKRELQ